MQGAPLGLGVGEIVARGAHDRESDIPLPSPKVVKALEPLLALLLATGVFWAIHAATPHIIGIDGYYHIKVASLIREHGPRLDFPWLRFTILNEAGYTDHHLLFHILQAPFTILDLRTAAKVSSVVFAALSFWGIYLIMLRSGVRWPLAWLLLLLSVAHTFLWRQSMARPQSLALLLLVTVLWVVFECRLRWLVPLGFISAWLFDGFILTPLVPLSALGARLLIERRLDWRPTALLLAGILAGLVVHPYFPSNLVFAWLHLGPKSGLVAQEPIPVGAEWARYSSVGFSNRVGPSLAVLCLGMVPTLIRLWRREPPEYRALTLTALAIIFLGLVVRSQRMIEYFPAFAVLTAAWTWSFTPLPATPAVQAYLQRWRPLLVGLAAVGLVLGPAFAVQQARRAAVNPPVAARWDAYREPATWLAANTPPRSQVFNTDWDDFPQLFFWNSHNVYIFGLDPTYMSIYDLDLYRLWRSISSGQVPNPSGPLRDRFGAQYVFTDVQHSGFLGRAAADPGLEEVSRSAQGVVFRVKAAP